MLMTASQTCRETNIGRTQLYCLIRSGKLRTVKIGTRGIRIPRTEVERFIREQMEEN
jgi:excisionase family DNA binding protein